jgi:choline dehydrogenase-like flavoprotein
MDNRQILVPFVNLKMIGNKYQPDTYQYHQVAISVKNENSKHHVHGLITTLKTALIHPLVQSVPFDLRTSISIFRNVHSALGLVNLNFPDQRRTDNYLTLKSVSGSRVPEFVLHYIPEATEKSRIHRTMRKLKKALRRLGCIVPPGMAHVRPMGASVHYAGTIPMSNEKIYLTASPYCQSHDFDNLFIVDGTTFPFLPAKNLTFTLMANAIRVAESAF